MAWRRSKLGRRMVFYILLCSSLITLVLTAIQLMRDYRVDVDAVGKRLQQVELANLDSIRESLWTLDSASLQLQLGGVVRLPDIERAVIRDPGGNIIAEAGQAVSEDVALTRAYDIVHALGDRTIPLGQLVITASLEDIHGRLVDKAVVILAGQSVKTFVVSLFILFIVYRICTRHLIHLAEYSRAWNPGTEMPPLRFDRDADIDDEFDTVAEAMDLLGRKLSTTLDASQASTDRFRKVFEGSLDAILIIDAQCGTVIDCNQRATTLLETSRDELRGSHYQGFHGDQGTIAVRFFDQAARSGSNRSLGLTWTTANGRSIPTETAASLIELEGRAHVLAIVRDRTERRLFERELERLAYNDSLTGLPNRVLFSDRLGQALGSAERNQLRGILLFIDLDNFKTINDSLGHAAGDTLLCTVARRLRAMLRENDTVARLGGDEFVVLVEPEEQSADGATRNALAIARKVRHCLGETLIIDGQDVGVTASIGVTVFPDDGNSIDELLRHADAAMYNAKSEGRNTASVYHPILEETASAKLKLGAELRQALAQNQFYLDYQPLIDLHTLNQVGAEALIRWMHPQRGLVAPGEFIPYLEETGLVLDVGVWILHEACRRWREAITGPWAQPGQRVAVNISSQQFRSPMFVDGVLEILDETGLDPARLELELTEHSLVRDLDDTQEKMHQLKEVGISLSLDDFGTGYSSLSYIHKLPVDKVKIDRSFVQDIDSDRDRTGLVDTIVTLGRKLGIDVVAEGVETQAQANYLRAQGCRLAQGYLYAAPGREPLLDPSVLRSAKERIVA